MQWAALFRNFVNFVSKKFKQIFGCCSQAKYASLNLIKVARYSFSGPIPLKFEHKLRRHKQSFGKIATTVVLDEDENLL